MGSAESKVDAMGTIRDQSQLFCVLATLGFGAFWYALIAGIVDLANRSFAGLAIAIAGYKRP